MATEIKLPRLGQGMESGTIVKWLKSEGERVEKGEPLYELDTDKVTQEVEADASGVLLKIAVEEGEVDVGRTIAVIGEEGEEVSVSENGAAQAAERAGPAAERAAGPGRGGDAQDSRQRPVRSSDGSRIKASPLARRIAREQRHRPRVDPGHRPGRPDRRRGRRARGDGRPGQPRAARVQDAGTRSR